MPHLVPRPTILQTAESILRIERRKWIYHERALANSLGNPEEPSLAHAVTGLSNYYQIGRKDIRDKQITMIRMVTGTHEALDICGAEYKTS
jgi:hypothetical protein